MKKKQRIAVIALIIVVALILWFGVFRDSGRKESMSTSGTVEATESTLGFLAAGRVETIHVREGDPVLKGDELALLDREEASARLRQAEAQAGAARALLEELEAGARPEELAQARAANDAAAEQLEDARRDYERAQKLHEGGAISREMLDKARTGFDVSRSRATQAEEALRQIETGPRRERITAQRAALEQAEANAAAVRAVLANMVIDAPFDGIITVRHREPGETVAAGSPVLTVQDREDRWVRIFVPEQRIAAVRPGTRATITNDTYADREYPGEVTFIATEAEFTPKTVQTTEERVRLVYAVKVRIAGDENHDLKPGMPVDVELDLSE